MILAKVILCLILSLNANGGIVDSILGIYRKKVNNLKLNESPEETIDSESLIALASKIGFDDGFNRDGLLGKEFPLIKWEHGKTVNLYTYVCEDVNDGICSWDMFLTMIYRYNLKLTHRYSNESLKLIHTFIICESFEGRHWSCPDPCLQDDICVHNGVKFECRKTYWGLYKSDYMCICRKNQVWNEEQRKCVYYDLCLWKSGVSCKAESGNMCVADRDGTYDCIPFKYDIKCKYRCEKKIEEACKKKLVYFHHLLKNGLNVCNDGECVINDTNEYGYSCRCPVNLIDNYNNPHPDCSIDTRTLCFTNEYTCVHGDCEWSYVVKKYICKCHKGFGGRHCDRPEAEWLEWGSWSACHADCNEKGLQIRKRGCNIGVDKCRHKVYQDKSHYNEKQYQECFLYCQTSKTELHFKWTDWSNCNGSCKNNNFNGIRTRKRVCVNSFHDDCEFFPEIDLQPESCYSTNCYEKSFLKQYNNDLEDKQMFKLTQWSKCYSLNNTSCSFGYKYRHTTCKHLNFDCNFKEIEVQNCINICINTGENYPWSPWTTWSNCINTTSCYRERYCYGSGCSKTINHKIEREYSNCDQGLCKSETPVVDVNYIYKKQGQKNSNAYFLTNSENEKSSYIRMKTFIHKSYEKYK